MQSRTGSLGVGLVLVLLGAAACGARPPRAEAAYGDVLQDGSLDGDLAVGGNHLGAAEDPALAALQVQLLQQYASNNLRSPWEQFLRAPQDKRQIRYRQCYFNPISCFRK